AAAYPSGQCVHHLFEEQAERMPEQVAVIDGEQQLTYGELNRRSNRLAYRLRALGVRPDDRVAICMERSPQLIVGVLGVLKAGAAYVPLDPSYPDERIFFMMKDSSPLALLTQRHLLPRFEAIKEGVQILELTNAPLVSLSEPETNPKGVSAGLNSECLAYVIYTSGSTGAPKGVAMTHRALVNLLWWQSKANSLFPLRTLQFAALGFDVAFQEIFSTLCFGGVLILIEDKDRQDPVVMARLVAGARVQRLLLPYAALQVFAEGVAAVQRLSGNGKQADWALQEIITAGEQLRIDPKISTLFKTLDRCTLENQYGPTETHVATSFTLSNQPEQWPMLPPIGRPIANAQIYILDEHLEPAPLGVVGELYLAGAGVARGYLNRAQLTAERFLMDPFTKQAGARMYKTGDLGRWRKDGTIEFIGRNDFQVKVRGFRIELGEIEARLAEHARVGEAVVVAGEDEYGNRRLVAYYTRARSDAGGVEAVDAQALRRYLLERLPEHMVPAAYVEMEKLPLSPNGKLDRKALPAPVGGAYSSSAYEAPTGETETILARIWSELLKIERVGRWDNFFELGGHSLLAVRLISKIRRVLDVELPISDIFAHPVLSQLADQIITHQLNQFDPAEIARLAKGI
ncbi:MAG TPA: amino acid adenylation domain-containing protein, partial [Candidatus Angelobacter sp.]|nr:amino acid adenylation domain-containing protein [Candidatus Angelobacter sp.]